MFSYPSKTFTIKGLLLLTALSSLLLLAQATSAPVEDFTGSIQNAFRNRSYCFYNPSQTEITMNLVLLTCGLLSSLVLLSHFLFIRRLFEKPGNILFSLSLVDALSTANQIIINFYCLTHSSNDSKQTIIFTISNSIDASLENLVSFYHISLCLFHLFMLSSALKGPGVPSFFYHLFPFTLSLASTYFTYFVSNLNISFPMKEFQVSVVKYGSLAALTLLFGTYIEKRLPEFDKIGTVRSQFLTYHRRYLGILRYIFVTRGLMAVLSSYAIVEDLHDNVKKALSIGLLLSHAVTGTTPIFLTLSRFRDPIIREYWDKFFANRKVLRSMSTLRDTSKENTENTENTNNEGSTQTEGTSEASGNPKTAAARWKSLRTKTVLFQNSVKNKSQIYQIQYTRKVQVVYSILSGIHYYWHMRENDKLEKESETNQISSLKEIIGEEERKEKYNIELTFQIKDESLQKEVPDIYEEISHRGYNLAQGKFIIYAPEVFDAIIKLDNTEESIVSSLDLKENLIRIASSGINTAGQSGEFFLFSRDNRLMIKTVTPKELKILLKRLPKYSHHMKKNPGSLISKIYGLYTLEVEMSLERYHFILMKNISEEPSYFSHRKYDLKGSTVGRRSIKDSETPIRKLKFKTLKDLDFNQYDKKISMSAELKGKLRDILEKDVEFLSSLDLLDYSLILFVVDKSSCLDKDAMDVAMQGKPEEKPDPNQPFRSLFDSTEENVCYKIGIIDYLTEFGIKKKLEIFFKKLFAMNPNHNISAQRPKVYGDRFLKYVNSIIE